MSARSSRARAQTAPVPQASSSNRLEDNIPTLADVALEGKHPDPTLRKHRIAVLAYFKAQERGFVAGNELDDWLAAERELDAADGAEGDRLASKQRPRPEAHEQS
jgi:hypothetical protein